MQIESRQLGPFIILRPLTMRLSDYRKEELHNKFKEFIDDDFLYFALNLSLLKTLDAECSLSLLNQSKTLESLGGKLVIFGLESECEKLFGVYNRGEEVGIVDSQEEAIEYLKEFVKHKR